MVKKCKNVYFPKTIKELKDIYSTCVQSKENKMVILYGLHEPYEPTSIIVEQLKLPENIVVIKHPFANTPREVYINIGRNLKKIISLVPNGSEINKKVNDNYNSMKLSFEKRPGKVGDVQYMYLEDFKGDLRNYFVNEYDLVEKTVNKRALTILVHADVQPSEDAERYYGCFLNNGSNFNLFNCRLPKKYHKFERIKKSASGCPVSHLELELVFPNKYVLRNSETPISDTEKKCLYKAYSLIGRDISKQHSWTYATQSYSVDKLMENWIMKRINALEDLLIQFVDTD